MKLEASLKHFSPQGMHINDDVKSTSPNRLNGTDVIRTWLCSTTAVEFESTSTTGAKSRCRSRLLF
ncbi:hypothetical protein ACI2JR_27895, partial [Klebsiella sp. NPDC088457]